MVSSAIAGFWPCTCLGPPTQRIDTTSRSTCRYRPVGLRPPLGWRGPRIPLRCLAFDHDSRTKTHRRYRQYGPHWYPSGAGTGYTWTNSRRRVATTTEARAVVRPGSRCGDRGRRRSRRTRDLWGRQRLRPCGRLCRASCRADGGPSRDGTGHLRCGTRGWGAVPLGLLVLVLLPEQGRGRQRRTSATRRPRVVPNAARGRGRDAPGRRRGRSHSGFLRPARAHELGAVGPGRGGSWRTGSLPGSFEHRT